MTVEEFLARVRRQVESQAPHLQPLLNVMSGEARFARAWLDEDLRKLPRGAHVLEVGGGAFLLACSLAAEGFSVTAIEPLGSGFGAFEELGVLVLALAAADARPEIARCKAEEFTSARRYTFAFSVNVMEHVDAPETAVARVSAVLAPGGQYRFLCPNYLFPYEPHFNIPTFGSKQLTARLMRSRIESARGIEDPAGLWRSLNWINVPQVRRIAATDRSLSLTFDRRTLVTMVERAVDDEAFAKRRSAWMVTAIRAVRGTGLLRFASRLPASWHPVMDARLTKIH